MNLFLNSLIRRKTSNTRETGQLTENLSVEFLRRHNISIIEQNYSFRGGEIDLIGREQQTLIFFEIRFRKNNRFGQPTETVDFKKQQKIIKTAQHYLQQHQLSERVNCRFDVIGLIPKQQMQSLSKNVDDYQIDWIQHAFDLA